MSATSASRDPLDTTELAARIYRHLEETLKFVSEQRKLDAAAAKLRRDRELAPWVFLATGAASATTLIAAGAGLVKLFGH